MLQYSELDRIDCNGMHKIYDEWPKIARNSYEMQVPELDFSGINHIVFAGMGGSGALGDIFEAILSKTNLHVSVIKGYLLPKTTDSKTLVVTTSVSGNTVETLNVLNCAKNQNCKIIAFSSGGKMETTCLKNNIPFQKISKIHSPRASFPSFLYSMIKVLNPIIFVKSKDIFESLDLLEKQRKKIFSGNMDGRNPAIELAEWINGIPMVYYPWGLQAAAIHFKNSFQENAKLHIMTEDVIEACHNGIVSWEKKSTVQPILLEGKDDYFKTQERWRILKEYFKKNNIQYQEIKSVNGSILSKLINLIYFLDYVSIYKAILTKTDPSPVNSIDFIKRRL